MRDRPVDFFRLSDVCIHRRACNIPGSAGTRAVR